jgi:pilus assembly protein Flp/PilA
MRRLIDLLRCQKGANAIEYALVASLIAVAAVAAFKHLGTSIDSMLTNVSNAMG